MNFEIFYSKLPNFLKYNKYIYKLSLKLSNKLRNLGKNKKEIDSQYQLLNLLFTNSEIKLKGHLRDIQLLYVELLRFIDNVCNKYGIEYWIDYGTLLGAYRHGGFIPWDDDLDISIMRKDYEKLIEILPEEINQYPTLKKNCGLTLLIEGHENYFKDFKSVYDVNNEKQLLSDYKFPFLQIALMKPYIKIDIFPKDYILNEQLEKYSKNYEIEKYIFNQKLEKNQITYIEGLKDEKIKLGQTDNETKFCANSVDHVLLEPPVIFEVKNIFPLKTIKFEDYYFKCPNNIPAHLKPKFGNNYMQIPRIMENHNLEKFIDTQFNSPEERDKAFKDTLEYLRDINEKF